MKVFATIPADEKVTTVDEFFVPAFSSPPLLGSAADWPGQRNAWMKALREEVFGAWPGEAKPTVTMQPEQVRDGLRLTRVDVTTQHPFVLPVWILQRADLKPEQVRSMTFQVLNEAAWEKFHQWEAGHFRAGAEEGAGDGAAFLRDQAARLDSSQGIAFFCPRGVGPTSLAALSKVKQTHLLRRFLLLGESLESGQVWDIRQAVEALRSLPGWSHQPLSLRSGQVMGANALYASLYLEGISRLELQDLPVSHRAGPTYLNVLRYLDLPQALAMAAEHTPVTLYTGWKTVCKSSVLNRHRCRSRPGLGGSIPHRLYAEGFAKNRVFAQATVYSGGVWEQERVGGPEVFAEVHFPGQEFMAPEAGELLALAEGEGEIQFKIVQ